jgi:hypothetical protein
MNNRILSVDVLRAFVIRYNLKTFLNLIAIYS